MLVSGVPCEEDRSGDESEAVKPAAPRGGPHHGGRKNENHVLPQSVRGRKTPRRFLTMAKTGRKPKPAARKLLEGNAGKRKIRPDLPAPIGAPPMPERLAVDPNSVAKWNELVPILLSLKTLSTADQEALATLCEVYAAAQSCLLELRASGPVLRTDLGGVKPNPAGSLYRSLVGLQVQIMGEFGLTPTSRVRLGGQEEKPKDEVEEYFRVYGA